MTLTVTLIKRDDALRRIQEIESQVPAMKDAYESDDNHGDSCWHAAVGWNPLAHEYGGLMFLLGSDR